MIEPTGCQETRSKRSMSKTGKSRPRVRMNILRNDAANQRRRQRAATRKIYDLRAYDGSEAVGGQPQFAKQRR